LKKKRSGGFQSMDLSKEVFRAIMKKGFKVPTPIQRKTIPHVLGGKDVVAMARTGSGKTAAFVIPMLEKLVGHSPTAGVRAVVLSPTRELCQQTERVVREMARFTDLQTALLIGGESMEAQFAMLSKCPDIIIAAPGRLVHLLLEVKEFSLKTVQYLVFDEADRYPHHRPTSVF
jgi:ATP-dependent RNA helicase DDX54/DBP10